MAKLKIDPSAVSFLEGSSFSRSKDSDFVEKAWDFKKINRMYEELLGIHANTGEGNRKSSSWIRVESDIWSEVFQKDPFLPNALLPKGYLGKKAIRQIAVLTMASF